MFEFRHSMAGALKAALPAAALALSLVTASPGQAADIFLQSATMDTSYTAHIYSSPFPDPGYSDEHVFLGPLLFTANAGIGYSPDSFQLLAFCVDIFHNINLGPLGLQYDDTQPFSSNSQVPPVAISGAQQLQVAKLVNYGQLVFTQGDALKTEKLAGLQGAIWQVINPTYTVVSYNGTVDGLIAQYADALTYDAALTGHGGVGASIGFISETGKYGTLTAHQSFAFAVPEPATWGLMILGFGAAGCVLRRARRTATLAA
jgi:hypothetical protein